MPVQPPLTITFLTRADAADAALLGQLTALVNEVYKASEQGIWVDGAARTDLDEVTELVRRGELCAARLDGELVGCIRMQRLDDSTSEFGMLAAAPKHRGIGIGRDLVRFAEANAKRSGHTSMQLEVLVPTGWAHPAKEFLKEWYQRIGYTVVEKGDFQASYPHLAPLLATPCDYVIFRKTLA
jgi:GNAT superfamily N-acetyltransferase